MRNMLTYPVSYTYGIWVVSDSVFEQLSENEKEGLKAAFQVLGEKLSGAIEQRNESAEKVMKRYKTSFLPPSSSLETEWRTVYRVKSSELFNDKGFSLKQIADKIEKILID